MESYCRAVKTPGNHFDPFHYELRPLGQDDVLIDIQYCGICHTDVHQANQHWGPALYPMVPGHEIVGFVQQVGSAVKKYKVGDKVGVGCMVNSCGQCHYCLAKDEQLCRSGSVFTYNDIDRFGDQKPTYGGYSTHVVVKESFVLKIPDHLDLKASAPLLCAGITSFAPLERFGVTQGTKVGIAGLGGLGHMGVKIASAMGAEVTLFTRSAAKAQEGKRLGAHQACITTGSEQDLQKWFNSQDIILDFIPASHDLTFHLNCLSPNGTLVLMGAPEHDHPGFKNPVLVLKQLKIAGSVIGGIEQTQRMLDFCGQHNLTSDIELINADYIEKAYERLEKADVRYRFVIDIQSIKNK